MTVYQDLTTDEQRVLSRSLRAAAVFISAASPGRATETASEGFAVAELILDSQAEWVANPLVSSTILELKGRLDGDERFPDYVAAASAPGASEEAEEALRAVVALLDEKSTSEEAAGFKAWLLRIAETAATAGKEDQGFRGTGGVLVNDAEREALRRLADLLGVA